MKRSSKVLLVLAALAVFVLSFGAVLAQDEAVFAGGWPYSTPPTGHFNMFLSGAIELKFWREIQQHPLATYVAETDTYDPLLATAWEASEDGASFKVTLRDDAKWVNGDAFTAKDVWTTFMVYRLVNNAVWSYIDNVEIVSDTEVNFSVKTPTSLIIRQILRKPMVDYASYGSYADQVQALLDEGKNEESAEWAALSESFNTFRPEFVNATGPFYMDTDSISESCIELKKNENSFLADAVKFDKILVYNGDVPELTPLVLNQEVDFLTHVFPPASVETFSAMGYDLIGAHGKDGIAIYFNESVAPLDQKSVRQAFAYIIDRDRVGEIALPGTTVGNKYVTGLADVITEVWVDVEKLNPYEVNHEKAAELLEASGLSKHDDGQWYLADGKPFTISIQCPTSWSDASAAAMEMAQELTAFGIKTNIDGIDSTMRQTNIIEGEYQVAVSFFGSAQPHPMYAYETPLLVSNVNAPSGLNYPMVQETESCGTVDLSELLVESTAGWDTEAQKAAIEKIALTINETVPYLPIYVKNSKYISSRGLLTDWGTDESLYLNSAGDDSYVVIKLLRGEIAPID